MFRRSLTKPERALLPLRKEEWRAVGLDTRPIDRDEARAAIDRFFAFASRAPPKVLFFRSPLGCLVALATLRRKGRRGGGGGTASEASELSSELRSELWSELRSELSSELRSETVFIGGQNAYWLSWVMFLKEIGYPFQARHFAWLEAYAGYARACGWMFALPSTALVSDRPEWIRRDERRRLHSADGMALRFRDGFGLWRWHGLRVPSHFITAKEKIDAAMILGEANVELRRVLCEIVGWDRAIEMLGARVIAEDEESGQKRRLLEVELGTRQVDAGVGQVTVLSNGVFTVRHQMDDTPQPLVARLVELVNGTVESDGTRRKFIEGVPLGCRTPAEAVAWQYGDPVQAYREDVRT